MTAPFLDLTQTQDGWRALFALQVFHRSGEEWLKMRWGFNAGILLEEALDRQKLFLESQVASEAEYRAGIQPVRALALRGINYPGAGLQMGLLGSIRAPSRGDAVLLATNYARALGSTFPQDFIVIPAETGDDYRRLCGEELLGSRANIAQIQRGVVVLPAAASHRFIGLWQASSRSYEQIWRALSGMPVQTIFNILVQPTFLYESDRKIWLGIRQQVTEMSDGSELPVAAAWITNLLQRRLAVWRKYFLLQVHVITAGEVDEPLLRSIGTALTRDSIDLPLPGFQINRPDSEAAAHAWRQSIRSMDFIPASRIDDIADSEEAHAVFRFPYRPENGLPGADFVGRHGESAPAPREE